jgi:hypothetical protein
MAIKKPYFAADEVASLVEVMAGLYPQAANSWDNLTIHLSLDTIANIKFTGPVGLDELDALLAHIAFYKTFFKEGETRAAPSLEDFKAKIIAAVSPAPTPKETHHERL